LRIYFCGETADTMMSTTCYVTTLILSGKLCEKDTKNDSAII